MFVCQTASGEEAVQKAQELQPDLVLMDISLPKMSGIEAARQVRNVSPKSLHHLPEPTRFFADGE